MEQKPSRISKKTMFELIAFTLILIAIIYYFRSILAGLNWLTAVFMPLILGAAIAFVLNMPVSWFEKKVFTKEHLGKFARMSRGLSIVTTLLCFILGIVLILVIVVPQLVKSTELLVSSLPDALTSLSGWLKEMSVYIPSLESSAENVENSAGSIQKLVTTYLSSGLSETLSKAFDVASSAVGQILTFFIGLMFSLYVLASKEALGRQFRELALSMFSKKTALKIFYVFHLTSEYFQLFISSQCLEALILFGMYIVVALVFRLPYSIMIAVLIGVFSLIPLFGAYIAWGIASFLLLTVNPWDVVTFTIIFLVISQIEGNLIYPHIVGNSMGIPGIWVLAAVTVGGNLMGLLGMIIAVPVAAVFYTLIVVWKNKTLSDKNISWEMYANSPDWQHFNPEEDFLNR